MRCGCQRSIIHCGDGQAQVNPSLFQDMHWRNIGHLSRKGGFVSGVNGRPGLRMWVPIMEGLEDRQRRRHLLPVTDAVQAVRALPLGGGAVATVHRLCGHRQRVWFDYSAVCGITDAGAHWQSAGLQNAGAIAWLLVTLKILTWCWQPRAESIIAKGSTRRVRSIDGGRTWTMVLNAEPSPARPLCPGKR